MSKRQGFQMLVMAGHESKSSTTKQGQFERSKWGQRKTMEKNQRNASLLNPNIKHITYDDDDGDKGVVKGFFVA